MCDCKGFNGPHECRSPWSFLCQFCRTVQVLLSNNHEPLVGHCCSRRQEGTVRSSSRHTCEKACRRSLPQNPPSDLMRCCNGAYAAQKHKTSCCSSLCSMLQSKVMQQLQSSIHCAWPRPLCSGSVLTLAQCMRVCHMWLAAWPQLPLTQRLWSWYETLWKVCSGAGSLNMHAPVCT